VVTELELISGEEVEELNQARLALKADKFHSIYLSNQALCMLKQELVEEGITLAFPFPMLSNAVRHHANVWNKCKTASQ